MIYIDPNIYNPKDLVGEDKIYIQGYMHALEDSKVFFDNLEAHTKSDTLDKIYSEFVKDAAESFDDWAEIHLTETTCSIMESNLEVYGEDEDE